MQGDGNERDLIRKNRSHLKCAGGKVCSLGDKQQEPELWCCYHGTVGMADMGGELTW